jgi:tetrahydromethanopterin S-methyltransferase subunit G
MLIVKEKDGERVVAAQGDLAAMQKQFDELKSDTDFDTIEIIDRVGRVWAKQEASKPVAKKSAKN